MLLGLKGPGMKSEGCCGQSSGVDPLLEAWTAFLRPFFSEPERLSGFRVA